MDNHTTDKGWAAMREMLDREMPQQPQHRLLWWWFALVLLPLAVFGTWKWLNADSQGDTPSALPLVEAPRAIAGNEPASTTNNIVDHSNDQNEVQNATKASSLRSVTATPHSKQHVERNPGTAAPLVAYSQAPVQTTHTDIMQVQDASIEPKSGTAEKSLFSTTSLPIQTPDIQLEIATSTSIAVFGLAKPPKPVKPVAGNPWAIGAISAISCERFNQVNGFSTGINVDRKIAPKWGLRGGLLYNIYTPQEKTRPVATVLPEAYASNIAGKVTILNSSTGQEVSGLSNASFYADSIHGNIFIPVNRMQRLEVPIAVFWQPVQALKVFAGFHFSRTLKTRADRINYAGNYILQLADRSAEESVNKISSNELNNWRADAALGVGISAGRHLEFGITGRMAVKGFDNFSNPEQFRASASLSPSGEAISTRSRATPILSLYGTIIF